MFHTREVDWSQYTQTQDTMTHDTRVVVDTRSGERRLMVQSPIPMEYMDTETGLVNQGVAPLWINHQQPFDNDDSESDGYGTPSEDSDDEDDMETVGVVRDESPVTQNRRFFSTPCGQTYWVDSDFYLYTNETVDNPIGYWCDRDQCVYLDDGSWDTSDDDDDDDYDPPPTPPPMYEESDSVQGSPVSMDADTDSEVDGEVIVMALSQ